jgi:hypothetical protein
LLAFRYDAGMHGETCKQCACGLQFFEEALECEWTIRYSIVPDEQHVIEQAIIEKVRYHKNYSMENKAMVANP